MKNIDQKALALLQAFPSMTLAQARCVLNHRDYPDAETAIAAIKVELAKGNPLLGILHFPDSPSAPAALLVDSRGMGAVLSCSPHHVERLAARRFIPSVRLGRLRRFRVSDVLAALERRTQHARGCS